MRQAEAKVQEKEHNATRLQQSLPLRRAWTLPVVDGSGEGGKILLG